MRECDYMDELAYTPVYTCVHLPTNVSVIDRILGSDGIHLLLRLLRIWDKRVSGEWLGI